MHTRAHPQNPTYTHTTHTKQVCVWTPQDVPGLSGHMAAVKPGDYVKVKIESAGTATLFAKPICVTTL
jgi:hypothetical protein